MADIQVPLPVGDPVSEHQLGTVPTPAPAPGTSPAELESTVVRLRGLPFEATEASVKEFFNGIEIPDGAIQFVKVSCGRHSGQAYVQFATKEDTSEALNKDKTYLGRRYIEVFPAPKEEMESKTATPDASTWIRMRGLPFSASKETVKEFFQQFNVDDERIVLITKNGRFSGEAFVQFTDEPTAQAAMSKDKESIGTRYIELFLTSAQEVDATIARAARDTGMGKFGFGGEEWGHDSGADGFVVRLRGLPFTSTENEVREFLNGIQIASVTMAQKEGRFSGEAFVELPNQRAMQQALERNRHYIGQRYVEVFRSSRSEAAGGPRVRGAPPGANAGQFGGYAYGYPPNPAAGSYDYAQYAQQYYAGTYGYPYMYAADPTTAAAYALQYGTTGYPATGTAAAGTAASGTAAATTAYPSTTAGSASTTSASYGLTAAGTPYNYHSNPAAYNYVYGSTGTTGATGAATTPAGATTTSTPVASYAQQYYK